MQRRSASGSRKGGVSILQLANGHLLKTVNISQGAGHVQQFLGQLVWLTIGVIEVIASESYHSLPLQKNTIQIPLNTIEYHAVPLDHSMVFQQHSMVFPMVIYNTIQYHWTIQWYFSRFNGTLGYSMVFL